MNKNIFLITAGIITGIIFILPLLLFGILNAGNGAGLLLAAVLLTYGFFFGKTNLYVRKIFKTVPGKLSVILIIILILAAVSVTATYTFRIVRAANNAPDEETTVVVLGCKVKPSGPSLMLTTRLNAAFDYLSANPTLKCVLSGGQGTDEHISEALAMKNWLVERGISEERLYLEDKSTSTEENLEFSLKLIEKENLPRKITVITNEFHQYRAKILAGSMGIESYSVSAKTPFYLLPTYFVRELGGILVEELNI